MPLHDLKLILGEPARLQQDSVRYADLPHVMQGGGFRNALDLFRCQMLFRIQVNCRLEQFLGIILDPLYMLSRLQGTVLHHGTHQFNGFAVIGEQLLGFLKRSLFCFYDCLTQLCLLL